MKIKIISALCLALFITVSATSFSEDKGASMLQGKPFFSVRVDISGCRYEVRINDVPFLTNEEGFPITASFPINEWIAKGENEISLYLMPLSENIYEETTKDLDARCKANATLQVRQSGTPSELNSPINTISFLGDSDRNNFSISQSTPASSLDSNSNLIKSSNGDIIINEATIEEWRINKDIVPNFDTPKYYNYDLEKRIPIEKGVKISQKVTFNSSLPEWRWLSAKVIDTDEQLISELYQQYRNIQRQFLSKEVNADNFYSTFSERTTELAQAYYVNEKEMVPDGILECSKDTKKYETYEFPEKFSTEFNAHLDIHGNKKLARIVIHDGSSFIYFNETSEHGGSRSFSIYFRKENDKWIITR